MKLEGSRTKRDENVRGLIETNRLTLIFRTCSWKELLDHLLRTSQSMFIQLTDCFDFFEFYEGSTCNTMPQK